VIYIFASNTGFLAAISVDLDMAHTFVYTLIGLVTDSVFGLTYIIIRNIRFLGAIGVVIKMVHTLFFTPVIWVDLSSIHSGNIANLSFIGVDLGVIRRWI
jgi:hypothetical protein